MLHTQMSLSDMSHACMRHATFTNEPCNTYEQVMPHVCEDQGRVHQCVKPCHTEKSAPYEAGAVALVTQTDTDEPGVEKRHELLKIGKRASERKGKRERAREEARERERKIERDNKRKKKRERKRERERER